MARTDAHEALLARCPGYAAFVAEEKEMDPDEGLLIGFADWFMAPGEDADSYAAWEAEDFRAEWDRWHS